MLGKAVSVTVSVKSAESIILCPNEKDLCTAKKEKRKVNLLEWNTLLK